MDFVINNDDWLYAVEFGKNIVSQQAEYQEKKGILAEYGIPIEFAEEMKREGLSITDLKEAAQIMKNQKLLQLNGLNHFLQLVIGYQK